MQTDLWGVAMPPPPLKRHVSNAAKPAPPPPPPRPASGNDACYLRPRPYRVAKQGKETWILNTD